LVAAWTVALAAVELAGDKMKTAPDRIVPIVTTMASSTKSERMPIQSAPDGGTSEGTSKA
jgi:hypothetical protein